MASSTTRPVARVMPKSVSVLMEKLKSLTKANAPISETGMVIAGISVLRQVCRKKKITMMTIRIASAERLEHFADRFADGGSGVEGFLILQACRKLFGEPRHLGVDAFFHVERIGV